MTERAWLPAHRGFMSERQPQSRQWIRESILCPNAQVARIVDGFGTERIRSNPDGSQSAAKLDERKSCIAQGFSAQADEPDDIGKAFNVGGAGKSGEATVARRTLLAHGCEAEWMFCHVGI
jgi:hypothetical protein